MRCLVFATKSKNKTCLLHIHVTNRIAHEKQATSAHEMRQMSLSIAEYAFSLHFPTFSRIKHACDINMLCFFPFFLQHVANIILQRYIHDGVSCILVVGMLLSSARSMEM